MKVCVIGAGYVGLVSGACFAEMGNDVWCIDTDQERVEELKNGHIPIYEPGLEELIKENVKQKRLRFDTQLTEALDKCLFVFITVGTPQNEEGAANLNYVLDVAKKVGQLINNYKIIVIKSTVPMGTYERVKNVIKGELILRNRDDLEFDIVSCPEFMKEGAAIKDFMSPDRVIIGTENVRTAELVKELYSLYTRNNNLVYIMSNTSAEMSKYGANAMLATRISFMNELARLCEETGADIEEVRVGLGADKRIGISFLYAGIGYGGSCFPKDIKALIHTGKKYGLDLEILKAVDKVNIEQKKIMVKKILDHFGGHLVGKKVAIWGLSFKPNTDDIREAPSLEIIKGLRSHGASIQVYDPVAISSAKKFLGNDAEIKYFEDYYEVLSGANCLVLVTEWPMFHRPDFEKMKELMIEHVIFDGRNQYPPKHMKKLGYTYYCIGRSY